MSLYQISTDFMKRKVYQFLSLTDFEIEPSQKWSPIFMTMSLKNINEKHFNILVTFVNIFQRKVAGEFKRVL